jgi:diadenosine tetraphosphate (Ap4A) HIT family hydrolase
VCPSAEMHVSDERDPTRLGTMRSDGRGCVTIPPWRRHGWTGAFRSTCGNTSKRAEYAVSSAHSATRSLALSIMWFSRRPTPLHSSPSTPAVYGHVLVAPLAHREGVIADFTEPEYLGLQRTVRRVGDAVQKVVQCERLYVLSLGSQAANAHVHWHLVPCPPGLPYKMQQVNLLLVDRDGYVALSFEEMAALASTLRGAIEEVGR